MLAVATQFGPTEPGDGPLPRAKRRRRKRREEQGLGNDDEIAKLAEKYLTAARGLWPDLANAGLLPAVCAAAISEMVADFKQRHLTGNLSAGALEPFLLRRMDLAADYPRFSDLNSDPKSIIDQMLLALERAKEQGYFIPWQLIFADYARSATHGHRQGFENMLRIATSANSPFKVIYINDFHRGSRNRPEWWNLAATCKKFKIRVVGVSDGFHLDGDDWDLRLSIYTALSELETKNKRRRVRLGMAGAAGENRSLGKPPFGRTRRIKRDANGNIERKPNGAPKKEYCIDPATDAHVQRMFDLFINQKWTAHRIMRLFNRERVEDWDGWTEGAIRDILTNPCYYGLFIWNRTRREFDPLTQKMEIVPNPWREWKWFFDQSLASIPKACPSETAPGQEEKEPDQKMSQIANDIVLWYSRLWLLRQALKAQSVRR